ncbi:SMP-30/gluconolactonase/LRE family protein [Serratia ureilytica]
MSPASWTRGRAARPVRFYRYDSALNAQVIHRGLALPNGGGRKMNARCSSSIPWRARSFWLRIRPMMAYWGCDALFVETPAELGRPDGIAWIGLERLWVCRFNGGCLLRYDRNGRLSDRVAMPVPRPTSCCFGGDGLDTLFITTARFAMTPSELADYPDAGDLYAIRPGSLVVRHLFKE